MKHIQTIRKFDKSNLLDITHNFPEDAKKAFKTSSEIILPANFNQVKNIIISGMGGSCISGDLFKSYLYNKSSIPVIVNRSSLLPNFADNDSLCVFISYSGNTLETLACAKEAVQRNCKAIIITRGGELEQFALGNNLILVKITGSEKMPRAAIGDLFYSLLGIMKNIAPLGIDINEVEASINSLDEIRKNVDIRYKADNWLIQIASNMVGKKIVIFGVSPSTEAIALRWKNQLNENSKSLVLYNSFPELTHNEIVGLTATDLKDYYFLIIRDQNEDSFLKKQIDNTLLFFKDCAGLENISESSPTLLERQMRLVYLGDYLSIYLALLNGIDPTPIEAIMQLKEKMNN